MTEVSAGLPEMPIPSRAGGRSGTRPRGGSGAILLGAVAALLLVAAGVMGYRPARFAAALNALSSQDPAERERAGRTLVDLKAYAAARLASIASDASQTQRLRAIRGIAVLDLKEAAGTVRQLATTDPAPGIREEALRTLGQFANGGDADSLKALLDAADQATGAVPGMADAVSKLAPGDEAGKRLLCERGLKALGPAPQGVPGIRAAYLEAAGGLLITLLSGTEAAPPEALPLFQAVLMRLADPDPAVRAVADKLLRQVQGSPRVALAIESLAHEDPWIRIWAESALRQVSGMTTGCDPFAPEAERKPAIDAWRAWAKSKP